MIIYNVPLGRNSYPKIEEINGVTLVKFGREKVKSYVSDSDKILGIKLDMKSFESYFPHLPHPNTSLCVSFIGPTHAGKSTLIKMLQGHDPFGDEVI